MARRVIRIMPKILSLIALLGVIGFLIAYWEHIPEREPDCFG